MLGFNEIQKIHAIKAINKVKWTGWVVAPKAMIELKKQKKKLQSELNSKLEELKKDVSDKKLIQEAFSIYEKMIIEVI